MTEATAPMLQDGIDRAIVDPATYANPEQYDALFSHLRADDPVHWTEPQGHRPFWTVTKYADIQNVEIRSTEFVNAPRLVLRDIETEERVKALTGGRSLLLRNLVNMDGADHQTYRRLTHSWFMPSRLKTLEADLHELARQYIERMIEAGGSCDFVQDVAIWYPLRVIMRILGVPATDEATMLKLTQQIFGPSDPDVKKDPNVNLVTTVDEFFDYFGKLTEDRRKSPGDDVATVIANAQINGVAIPDLEAWSYYILIATAGHDTTSSTTAGGLLALIQNPGQMAKLRANPNLLPGAIDEMFRWVTPVKNFFRTAAIDAEVGGRQIREGESLLMCYPSGNRDEAVFKNPFTFDITRSPNKHLAFGYGPHLCLGQHLAKMEIRVFYEELLARIDDIQLAGAPAWTLSNFATGLKRLPIRYSVR